MINNYIFTVTAGRSGQATLYDILQRYSLGCFSDFEAPRIHTIFPSFLGDIEKKIRRNFIETNELLGRGKILTAYDESKNQYIENIVNIRLAKIERQAIKMNADTYFDVSKFYARGLHLGFNKILDEFSLVLLVRDPLLNMRSFLNRKKDFFLDNSKPDANNNILKMNSKNFSKGEFYLWAWSEMILRYIKMSNSKKVKKSIIISNDDLLKPDVISNILDYLNVSYKPIDKINILNTNLELGLDVTNITEDDIKIMKTFISRIPSKYLNDLNDLTESLQKHEEQFNN